MKNPSFTAPNYKFCVLQGGDYTSEYLYTFDPYERLSHCYGRWRYSCRFGFRTYWSGK